MKINELNHNPRKSKYNQKFKFESKTMMLVSPILLAISIVNFARCIQSYTIEQQYPNYQDIQLPPQFPGISRDLASFCTARPSFPIDLASMVVHVKRNVSFNYKLYLFSADHVVQTGQIVPRDDFRIHSFPVKLKHLNEFWPAEVTTYQYNGKDATEDTYQVVPASRFSLSRFLRPVLLKPSNLVSSLNSSQLNRTLPEDVLVDALPGDPPLYTLGGQNLNRDIEFDRDDQLSVRRKITPVSQGQDPQRNNHSVRQQRARGSIASIAEKSESIVPVGSFSSFHLDLAYLVRKDFGQTEPEIVRIHIDANRFIVTDVVIFSSSHDSGRKLYLDNEDFNFLSHELLRDEDTRITGINQIYEDWITRNFYTIVYIQRKSAGTERSASDFNEHKIITDRLIFRGSSTTLLGADQLDYAVKATAFITEKNGLHYYLEFLTKSKFYLCAVDWTKRPLKLLDSRRYPIKATKTQFDNEEILLCPPAVCYSNRPIDTVVSYGRIPSEFHEVSSNPNLSDSSSDSRLESKQFQLDVRLHLRDWIWPLKQVDPIHTKRAAEEITSNTNGPTFAWRYELAKRNDIKFKYDTYGYTLMGHEIDASYRIRNELYLVSANHLITINYTLVNETVTSSQPISAEFFDLTSSLSDPITGAFYDRFTDKIFFFKGDRYVGYDYSTKKPMEDFLLPAPRSALTASIAHGANASTNERPLVSSLPVIGVIGRQMEVDGVYHDLATDLVYFFSGMKFFNFVARDFKDGSFMHGDLSPPNLRCINKQFLAGCKFDNAYVNPCVSEDESVHEEMKTEVWAAGESREPSDLFHGVELRTRNLSLDDNVIEERILDEFNQQQQQKLRSIAGRAPKLLNLVSNNDSSSNESTMSDNRLKSAVSYQRFPNDERVFIYLASIIAVLTCLLILSSALLLILLRRSKRAASRRVVAALAHSQSNGTSGSLYQQIDRERPAMLKQLSSRHVIPESFSKPQRNSLPVVKEHPFGPAPLTMDHPTVIDSSVL